MSSSVSLFLTKFFTKEDSVYYHRHKILGGLALAHFTYRFWQWFTLGFISFTPDTWTLSWIFIHAMLSLTSLQFHIPRNRIRKLPMIWPEFRIHSIVFAMRSILVMSCFWSEQYFHMNPMLGVYARSLIVLSTLVLADIASNHYKKQQLLHPDETTMRSMPFPDYVPDVYRSKINLFYSVSQVIATSRMLFVTGMSPPFLVLFPIQLAAFLMTLVRKGYLSSGGWHGLYSLALGTNYLYGFLTDHDSFQTKIPCISTTTSVLFCIMRFRYNVDKYRLWLTVLIVYVYLAYKSQPC